MTPPALHRDGWCSPLQAQVAAYPERVAVRTQGEVLTWQALYRAAAARTPLWRKRRQERGEGEVLGLYATRDLAFVVELHAALLAGASPLLLDPQLSDGRLPSEVPSASCFMPERDVLTPGSGSPEQQTFAPWGEGCELLSVLTSGTTGTPRRVSLYPGQVAYSALGGVSRLGSLPSDCWLNPLPLHHVGGVMILLRSMILGFEVELQPRFDAALTSERIDEGQVQLISLVPTMLQALLDVRDGRSFPSTLRAILLGGAAASGALLNVARSLGAPLSVSWGMSETASQVATTPPGEIRRAPLPLLPFMSAFVRDGALVLQGPMARGELVTSDRGAVSSAGIEVAGRLDEVFISGGENIDPREIERALEVLPAVREALIIALPDPHWGQRPHALVCGGGDPDEDELREHLRARIERYKIPETFLFVDALPRNSNGKVDRNAARELLERRDRV